MCSSANPYMAPVNNNKSFSYGGKWQPNRNDRSSGGLADTLSDMNSITWRTDDRDDDEDDDRSTRRRNNSSSSSSNWGDDHKDSYGGRRSSTRGGRSGDRSPRGWERDSSRRNLGTEFDASKGGGLSDSYRIPRSSGSVNWSDRGSSTRRDSMHDNKSRSRGRLNSSSRGSSSRSGGGGGGLSATWGGNRGR